MSWFIFSEVMFFAAFFGALFYARHFSVPWIGGEGDKGITGEYLWPNFSPTWPVINNPEPRDFSRSSRIDGSARSYRPGFSTCRSGTP